MSYQYILFTTVDITPTGVFSSTSKDTSDYQLKRNQQRNYDTLCQVISLRANIENPTVTSNFKSAVPTIFTNPNLPKHYTVWTLTFYCDRQHVFGERHCALINDLHMVPIVPNCLETLPQFPPYFMTTGDFRNVYISDLDYLII